MRFLSIASKYPVVCIDVYRFDIDKLFDGRDKNVKFISKIGQWYHKPDNAQNDSVVSFERTFDSVHFWIDGKIRDDYLQPIHRFDSYFLST